MCQCDHSSGRVNSVCSVFILFRRCFSLLQVNVTEGEESLVAITSDDDNSVTDYASNSSAGCNSKRKKKRKRKKQKRSREEAGGPEELLGSSSSEEHVEDAVDEDNLNLGAEGND